MKIGICGHFGGDRVFLDGQTVKTKNLTAEMKKVYGEDQVTTLDTYGGKKALLKCLSGLFRMLRTCDNIIILPAQNSVRIFPFYLVALNRFFKKKLHYSVIGAWLPELTRNKPVLRNTLKKLDAIYPETETMKKALLEQGFTNLKVIPNTKDLEILKEEDLETEYSLPLKICTFSRVTKLKGLDDITEAVTAVNREAGETIYTLDIYGQIEEGYREEFTEMVEKAGDAVNYMGMIDSRKSVETVSRYFLLAFPTRYPGEGLPGTIIDAYCSGVPVLSARWRSFSDVVDEGVTGIGYETGNVEELKEKLCMIKDDTSLITNLKKNCLIKAESFRPEILDELIELA